MAEEDTPHLAAEVEAPVGVLVWEAPAVTSGLIRPGLCLACGGWEKGYIPRAPRSPLLPGHLVALPVVVRMLAVKSRAKGRSQFPASEPLPRLETPCTWAARAVPSSSSRALGGRQAPTLPGKWPARP